MCSPRPYQMLLIWSRSTGHEGNECLSRPTTTSLSPRSARRAKEHGDVLVLQAIPCTDGRPHGITDILQTLLIYAISPGGIIPDTDWEFGERDDAERKRRRIACLPLGHKFHVSWPLSGVVCRDHLVFFYHNHTLVSGVSCYHVRLVFRLRPDEEGAINSLAQGTA